MSGESGDRRNPRPPALRRSQPRPDIRPHRLHLPLTPSPPRSGGTMVSRPAVGDKTTRIVRSSHPRYPRSTLAQDVTGWRMPRVKPLVGWPSQSPSAFQCESKLS